MSAGEPRFRFYDPMVPDPRVDAGPPAVTDPVAVAALLTALGATPGECDAVVASARIDVWPALPSQAIGLASELLALHRAFAARNGG